MKITAIRVLKSEYYDRYEEEVITGLRRVWGRAIRVLMALAEDEGGYAVLGWEREDDRWFDGRYVELFYDYGVLRKGDDFEKLSSFLDEDLQEGDNVVIARAKAWVTNSWADVLVVWLEGGKVAVLVKAEGTRHSFAVNDTGRLAEAFLCDREGRLLEDVDVLEYESRVSLEEAPAPFRPVAQQPGWSPV